MAIAAEQMGLEPTTDCPRAMNDADPKKGLAAAQTTLESHGLEISDENLFIAATCGDKGIAFPKGKAHSGSGKWRRNSPSRPQTLGDAGHRRGIRSPLRSGMGETFVDGEGSASPSTRIRIRRGQPRPVRRAEEQPCDRTWRQRYFAFPFRRARPFARGIRYSFSRR